MILLLLPLTEEVYQGFGQEWNDQISGDYGGQNMKDYLVAIDSLSNEPFVDKQKLGAVGASYGGSQCFG